tara:strand:+ start:1281 stop:1931 length:651 start_codon:yes stop_codon:yes gene_type:complete
MSFTYTGLKQAIQDYADNDETSFVTNLPVFIQQAEERILKSVQLNLFRKNVAGAMTDTNKFLTCPSDFLAPDSLSFTNSSGDAVFLDFKDVNFVQSFNPKASVTGNPRYYASFDVDHFILAPSPNASYAVELHYYYRPDSLTTLAGTGTTWLSENASIAMLYGSLVEAYTYMKGDADIMALYEKRFVESIMGLKGLGESKEVTDEYRTGVVRRPKQ